MELQQALESEKFTVSNLTASINNITMPPMRIAELGIFEERGIRTTTMSVEFKDGEIIIVPEKERGADGTHTEDRERKLFTFTAVHLPLEASIYADDIQNVRAFGSESELEQLDTLISDKQEDHRMSLDATIEYFRAGALTGKVLGAKGNTIVDLHATFGITPSQVTNEIDFTKPLRSQILKAKTDSKKNQKGVKGRRYHALCSESYFAKLMDNEDFVKAFERAQEGAALRNDVSGGVEWQGVTWEQYEDDINGKLIIPEGEARLFPTDKPKLFLTRFAPANYSETVNTIGLPYYSKSEPKRMGKGVDIESQSNVINICTNPLAVRRLTIKAA
ncbi:major capsid protein [Vibrio kanaloae]|uniref:major capsid protein n=1 Tax=Vibrio kanaloae TaxID=170673 RepID=UPI0010BEF9E2|nr:major capsid protein [Vibrio kanaloae]TKF76641.1 major capsid protein [Vibrio kanaloae]